jgi:CreA protein
LPRRDGWRKRVSDITGEKIALAFTEKRSVLFKRLHVSRFCDAPHETFVYMVWTDRLINGSPQNSISVVVAGRGGHRRPICR